MLEKQIAKESPEKAIRASDAYMSHHQSAKTVAVKNESVKVADRLSRQKLSLNGGDVSENSNQVSYSFLNKATKPEIMTMKEIAGVENTDNPKEAIRRMVIEAK